MINNPILAEMSVEDLQQRYLNTFVRYNNKIIYISSIYNDKYIDVIHTHGRENIRFDSHLLDISRPRPRWVIYNDRPYYVYYLFTRQFRRGFSSENTVIQCINIIVNINNNASTFDILNKMYMQECEKIKMSTEELLQLTKSHHSCVQLSPQIMVINVGKERAVFFREKFIGNYGSVDLNFVEELKEHIGDYKNENAVQPIRADEEPAKIKNQARPIFRPIAYEYYR